MNVLGLKITSHDTGAALISSGKVVAIAEERLCRIKHSPNVFPTLSIKYCLEHFELKPGDIDLVVIDQIDLPEKEPMLEIFKDNTGDSFKNSPIKIINHHDAHAAGAFFASPFKEAAVLVCDGAGEKFKNPDGSTATETETLYHGVGNNLKELEKTTHIRSGRKFPYTFGIGKLYTHISEFYLSLGTYNEGKMMGLAPYGNKTLFDEIPEENWYKQIDGKIYCNAQILFNRKITLEKLNWENIKNFSKNVLSRIFKNTPKESLPSTDIKEANFFKPVYLKKHKRDKYDILPDEYYNNVAFTVQKVLEKVTTLWAQKVKEKTQSQNLCVSGGVGLNIDANRNYITKAGFKNLFVQPAASDTGVALGCALYGYHTLARQPRSWSMEQASLGRPYSPEEIALALDRFFDKVSFEDLGNNIYQKTASLISEGYIIGWFSGGSEYGPRALGHRSILCNAGILDMRDILNSRVKHREMWRPFAASVLKEHVKDYFDLEIDSPFMLLAADVVEDKKSKIPSVVHVDGTCRIQTVSEKSNKPYWLLIKEFYKQTGIPLVLNTSFNLGGEPIVETPEDALDSFLRTNIDYLVIENFLITKKDSQKTS